MLADLAAPLRDKGELKLLEDIASEALAYLQRRQPDELNAKQLRTLAKALQTTGEVLSRKKESTKALSAFLSAQAALKRAPQDAETVFESAQVSFYIGNEYRNQRQYELTQQAWEQYAALAENLSRFPGKAQISLQEQGYALNTLGTLAYDRGDYKTAIGNFRRSLALKRSLKASGAERLRLDFAINDTASWIYSVQAARGELEAAADGHASTIRALEDMIAEDESRLEWKHQLARYRLLDAKLAWTMGRMGRAQANAKSARNSLLALTAAQPENNEWSGSLGDAHLIMADIARTQGDAALALESLHLAQGIARQLLKVDATASRRWRRVQARAQWMEASIRQDAAAFDEAIGELYEMHMESPEEFQLVLELAEALAARAINRLERADPRAALEDCDSLDKLFNLHSTSDDVTLVSAWVTTHRIRARTGGPSSDPAGPKRAWLKRIGYRLPTPGS